MGHHAINEVGDFSRERPTRFARGASLARIFENLRFETGPQDLALHKQIGIPIPEKCLESPPAHQHEIKSSARHLGKSQLPYRPIKQGGSRAAVERFLTIRSRANHNLKAFLEKARQHVINQARGILAVRKQIKQG